MITQITIIIMKIMGVWTIGKKVNNSNYFQSQNLNKNKNKNIHKIM
jgi:hypothetical protein